MKHTSVIVYPNYIDSQFKIFDGRKLKTEDCVETPNVAELQQAALDLGFASEIQPKKRHPRDFFRLGRVTVAFFLDADDPKARLPLNPHITKRKQLYKAMAERIRINRTSKPAEEPKAKSKHDKGKK